MNQAAHKNNLITLEQLVVRLERALHEAIDQTEIVEPLRSAITHSVFPPGKMIRPLLALSLCVDLGGDFEPLLPVAASLELLHTSSLIHDDLPAMDDDDMRRGRPSCHVAFSEATAILAGDFLVALSHNLISKSAFSDGQKVKLVDILSDTYLKLCNGQQLDLAGASNQKTLLLIHSQKTAALFSATMMFGAIGANSSQKVIEGTKNLGLQLGLAFQIVDDYLDLIGAEKGRKGGSDNKNNKTTFLNIDSIEATKHLVLSKRAEIVDLLKEIAREMKLIGDPELIFRLSFPIIDSVFSKVK